MTGMPDDLTSHLPDPHPASPSVPWTRRRFRAPRANKELLAVPPLADAIEVARANGRSLESSRLVFFGQPLSQLRKIARREALQLAAGADKAGDGPWFVTGHQPLLFHPGVWVKNFAASALAKLSGGVGLNLVVDNDVVAVPGIVVPAGDPSAPTLQSLPFDAARPSEAWENASIRDRDVWNSFGERLEWAQQPWGIQPLAREFWKPVAAHPSDRMAEALTLGRMRWERRWGHGNAELTISQMCETASFRRFACHLLSDIDPFHDLHNRVLEEYRANNRVRSRTHPVPDLREDHGWRETPFWAWRKGEAGRQRLFAQRSPMGVALRVGGEVVAELPLPADPEESIGRLEALSTAGWRLRSRALTTTLFARLFLADLFIHGIGGAKYDEMTDQLLARFYGVTPPEFMTLSGTLHLPFAVTTHTNKESACQSRLRELQQHPERHIPEPRRAELQSFLDEQAALIAEQHAVRAARRSGKKVTSRGPVRAQRLREIRSRLRIACASEVAILQTAHHEAAIATRSASVFQNREYAFVLYPEDLLRETLERWTS
jgi:hypothetical protein